MNEQTEEPAANGGSLRAARSWWLRIPRKRRHTLIVFAVMLVVYPSVHWLSQQFALPYGWQDASIPAMSGLLTSNVVESFAVSPDVPGLILVCAHTVELFSQYARIMTWRSRDYGQHWEILKNPFDSELTDYFAPDGGNGTFFAVETSNDTFHVSTLWVTHDQGSTWKQATSLDQTVQYQVEQGLAHSFYRNGQVYAMYPWKDGQGTSLVMSVSADDGKTWQKTTLAPSLLERQGWKVQTIAPDYRTAHAWFRVMAQGATVVTEPPVLEHSDDDGHHWQQLGQMGALTAGTITLATSASQPTHLCATNSLYFYWFNDNPNNNGPLLLLSSSDGGMSWHAQEAPPNPPAQSDGKVSVGQVLTNVVMADDGSCYQTRNFDWSPPQGPSSLTRDETTIYHLSVDGTRVTTAAFLPGYTPNGIVESLVFRYVSVSPHHGRIFLTMLDLQPDTWHSVWLFLGIMTQNIPPSRPLYWLPVS